MGFLSAVSLDFFPHSTCCWSVFALCCSEELVSARLAPGRFVMQSEFELRWAGLGTLEARPDDRGLRLSLPADLGHREDRE